MGLHRPSKAGRREVVTAATVPAAGKQMKKSGEVTGGESFSRGRPADQTSLSVLNYPENIEQNGKPFP